MVGSFVDFCTAHAHGKINLKNIFIVIVDAIVDVFMQAVGVVDNAGDVTLKSGDRECSAEQKSRGDKDEQHCGPPRHAGDP